MVKSGFYKQYTTNKGFVTRLQNLLKIKSNAAALFIIKQDINEQTANPLLMAFTYMFVFANLNCLEWLIY